MVSLVWSSFPSSSQVPQVRWGLKRAGAKVSAHSTTRVPDFTGTRVVRGLDYQAVSHAARPARLRVFSLSLMRLSQTHEIIMRHVPCNPIPPTCQLPVSEKSAVTLHRSSTRNGKRPRNAGQALFPRRRLCAPPGTRLVRATNYGSQRLSRQQKPQAEVYHGADDEPTDSFSSPTTYWPYPADARGGH